MTFNFIRFCEDNNIPYITHGVNVKVSDDCNISCPFCNDGPSPDPSFHLGVNTDLQVFSCWRDPTHRGRSLHRLLMKLLRCGYDRARMLLGQQPLWLREGEFDGLLDDIWTIPSQPSRHLQIPADFRAFTGQYSSEQPFLNYLADRGFKGQQAQKLFAAYGLYWAISGPFRHRIMFTNEVSGQLLNWTGRSIKPNNPVRYLSLSEADGAVTGIKQLVWNFDRLLEQPQRLCVVVEGPFDALKLDFLGRHFGLRATCVFGQSATLEQLGYLAALAELYDGLIVMFDRDSESRAEGVAAQLSWLPVWMAMLPEGLKDPGEMNLKQVRLLAQQLHRQTDQRKSI